MMEERSIELKIESAEDLKQVKWAGKMSPYAEAWVYPNHKVATKACAECGRNPKWDDKLHLTVAEDHLRNPNVFLTIDIIHHGSLGKKRVGTVRVPLSELAKTAKESQRMSYQVRRPSGRPQGVLNFVVTLGEKRGVAHTAMPMQQQQQAYKPGKEQPTMAYPVGYPPAPQAGYAPAPHAYPPQGLYPQQYPQQYGGYAPNFYGPPHGGRYGVSQMPPKRHGGGMGLGLGAGLLGGLLLGEALDNDCGDYGGDFGDFD